MGQDLVTTILRTPQRTSYKKGILLGPLRSETKVGHLHRSGIPHPEDVIASSTVLACLSLSRVTIKDIPNQHHPDCSSLLAVDILDGIVEQHVHVGIDCLQVSFVFRLAPLQADNDVGADTVTTSQSSPAKL